MAKAHYLADALCAVPGVKLRYPGDFFHEFVTDMPKAEEVLSALDRSRYSGRPAGGRRHPVVCHREGDARTPWTRLWPS